MNAFLNRWATPLTIGLFLVSGISGTFLFFHVAGGTFHEMHEWLSMVLLVPFFFHVWKNWRPVVGYAQRGALWLPLIASVVVAVPFAMDTGKGGPGGRRGPGNPAVTAAAKLVTAMPLTDLATAMHSTPQGVLSTLKQHGFAAEPGAASLDAIAQASHVDVNQLLSALFAIGGAANDGHPG